MAKDMQEIERRRDKINAMAEEHRRKRDEYNREARRWADRRDELNAKVRALVSEAAGHKARRDEHNRLVKEAKTRRDECNRRVAEIGSHVNSLKYARLRSGGVNIERLKRELRAKEKTQETSVLTREDEKELVESIARLKRDIREHEARIENDPEIRSMLDELKKYKEEAERHHAAVSKAADDAQREHDQMARLYEEADRIRVEADMAQDEFIKAKILADEEHKKHVDLIQQVRNYDKILFGMREKERSTMEEKAEKDSRTAAEGIYKKFKEGETLSTEDILILQKSGYL